MFFIRYGTYRKLGANHISTMDPEDEFITETDKKSLRQLALQIVRLTLWLDETLDVRQVLQKIVDRQVPDEDVIIFWAHFDFQTKLLGRFTSADQKHHLNYFKKWERKYFSHMICLYELRVLTALPTRRIIYCGEQRQLFGHGLEFEIFRDFDDDSFFLYWLDPVKTSLSPRETKKYINMLKKDFYNPADKRKPNLMPLPPPVMLDDSRREEPVIPTMPEACHGLYITMFYAHYEFPKGPATPEDRLPKLSAHHIIPHEKIAALKKIIHRE